MTNALAPHEIPFDHLRERKYYQPQRVNWWHEQIVDWELMNPDRTLGECAAHFNVTQSWLSTVRNSDIFREFRARRIAEHQSAVSKSVIDKVEGLAHLTVDTLHRRIEREKDEVPLGFVRETAETALKALGYIGRGNDARAQPGVNLQVNVVSRETLERARERMRLGQGAQNAEKEEERESIEDSAETVSVQYLPSPA